MNLLVRADAGAGIGAGHVMRCYALTQAWLAAGGTARFLMASGAESFSALFAAEGLHGDSLQAERGTAEDVRLTVAYAKSMSAHWIVLDGYAFRPDFQRGIFASGIRMLVVDDNGECAPCRSHLVLNQNMHASSDWYPAVGTIPRLLLGPRFALLRRQFRGRANREKPITSEAARILITMGGADPENLTGKAIEACAGLRIRGMEVIAVVGAMNSRLDSLKRQAAAVGVEVRHDVSGMAGLMEWADVALTAAGSTVWELLSMGVPSLATAAAENQRGIADRLEEIGAIVNLGWHAQVSTESISAKTAELIAATEKRRAMSVLGRDLVDGEGADRVVQAMLSEGRS